MKRITTMISVYGMVAFIAYSSCSLADSSSQIIGDWHQADFAGTAAVGDKCSIVTLFVRRLNISQAPNGTLVGLYSHAEQRLWLTKLDRTCKMPDADASNAAFIRTRFWSVGLEPNGRDSWKMTGAFLNCAGDFCSDKNLQKIRFQAILTRKGNKLEDSAEGVVGGTMKYRPLSEANARADDAADAFKASMRVLDAGNCNRFISDFFVSDNPMRQQQALFCSTNEKMRSLEPPIASTDVITKVAIDRAPGNSSVQEVDDVFLGAFAKFQNGTTLPRNSVMRRGQSRWEILFFFGR